MKDGRSVEGPHEIAIFTNLADLSKRTLVEISGEVNYPTKNVLDSRPEAVGAMDMTEIRALGQRVINAERKKRRTTLFRRLNIGRRLPFLGKLAYLNR